MKKLFIIIFMLFISTIVFSSEEVIVRTLLDDVTTTATGDSQEVFGSKKSFQLVGATATGAGTASILVQLSNDDTNWITVDTLALTLGATSTSDSHSMDAPWKYVRGVVNSITGTGATISLYSGELSRF